VLGTTPSASAALRRTGSGTITVAGGAATSDYAAVVVNSSTDPASTVSYTIRADNVLTSLIPSTGGALVSRQSVLFDGGAGNAPQLDLAFEAGLRARERRMMPRYAAPARAWYSATRPGAMMPRASRALVPGASVDGDTWYRLVNSVDTGVVNVRSTLGIDVGNTVRDWSVSNQVDDAASGIAPEYLQPSWNWHSIYPSVSGTSGTYPLVVSALPNGTTLAGSVIGGGAGYFRFTAPIGGSSTVTIADLSGASASKLQLVVVRTR
jgi:hypothetical protein